MIYANMKWMAFTLKLEELEGYDFWYADYHEEHSVRMHLKCGSTVRREKYPGSQDMLI